MARKTLLPKERVKETGKPYPEEVLARHRKQHQIITCEGQGRSKNQIWISIMARADPRSPTFIEDNCLPWPVLEKNRYYLLEQIIRQAYDRKEEVTPVDQQRLFAKPLEDILKYGYDDALEWHRSFLHAVYGKYGKKPRR